jgi:hypothetical protein
MRKWWSVALAAAIVAPAAAQDPKQGGAEKVALEKRAYPVEGEIGAERLNVRMFPRNDQTSIVTSTLTLGEKVTVVGEKDDFYQILPPRGSVVWVFARNIKKEGNAGVATANDIPLRLDSRMNADQVGLLKEGDKVVITGEMLGWYKIEAPEQVKYYVGKKYVRTGVALVAAPKPDEAKKVPAAPKADGSDAEAKQKLAIAEALLDEQRKLVEARKLDEVDFTGVVQNQEDALRIAKTETVKGEAERALRRYKEIHLLWQTFKAQKEAEQLRAARAIEEVARREAAKPKEFAFTGYVDTTGVMFKRPGTHKLIMGGKIVAFLRVKEGEDKMVGRFNDLYQKYVGVNGVVIKNPDGWDGYSVVVVEEITPLQQP